MTAAAGTQLIDSLRGAVEQTLDPLLEPGRPVALIDYPNHPNAGDSAIWLGEVRYLERRGVPVAYSCDFASYSEQRLRDKVGDGTILLHGGGSLGDVWEETQLFRERVVASFPDNPIVQLPQTIHFERPESLERTRAVFDAHPGLTILARDRTSLDVAHQGFETKTVLCPDMAFCIGAIDRPRRPDHDVLWLSRGDAEARHSALDTLPPGVERADWLDLSGREAGWRYLRSASQIAARRIRRRPALAPVLSGPLSRLQDPQAAQRVRAGSALLSSGRVVISDRLHAHILCLLMGIPHVLLDNSYGKLRNFRESWTWESPLARWAESADEALALARELAGAQGAS